jgi:hypothetical protein
MLRHQKHAIWNQKKRSIYISIPHIIIIRELVPFVAPNITPNYPPETG